MLINAYIHPSLGQQPRETTTAKKEKKKFLKHTKKKKKYFEKGEQFFFRSRTRQWTFFLIIDIRDAAARDREERRQ